MSVKDLTDNDRISVLTKPKQVLFSQDWDGNGSGDAWLIDWGVSQIVEVGPDKVRFTGVRRDLADCLGDILRTDAFHPGAACLFNANEV